MKLQKENNELRIELHKYWNYFQNMPQKSMRNHHTQNQSEKGNITIMMNLKKMKKVTLMLQKCEDVLKNKKKRIIYEDEIDGIPEYEPDSPTEEEQEEDNNYEIQSKHRGKQPNQIEKPKKVKKGITKSIKM